MGPNFDSNWIHTVKSLHFAVKGVRLKTKVHHSKTVAVLKWRRKQNSPVSLFSYTVVLEKDFFKDKFVPVKQFLFFSSKLTTVGLNSGSGSKFNVFGSTMLHRSVSDSSSV